MLRILLVSLCELNVRRLGGCRSCITSWLVVPLIEASCSRLAFFCHQGAGKEKLQWLLGCLVWSFLGSFDSRSLQIRCPFNPHWFFRFRIPKFPTNSFFHRRFWNFSTAMAWRDVCIWSKTSADVPRVKSLWSSPPMMRRPAVHGWSGRFKSAVWRYFGDNESLDSIATVWYTTVTTCKGFKDLLCQKVSKKYFADSDPKIVIH